MKALSTMTSKERKLMSVILLRRRRIMLYMFWLFWNRFHQSRPRKQRRFWVHPLNSVEARIQQGDHHNLLSEMRLTDVNKYFNHFRMSPTQFEDLLKLVGPKINRLNISREPISASLRLALTLRYLASGDQMISVARQFRVGESTTSLIIRETCSVIWEVLVDQMLPKPTRSFWLEVAREFERQWHFPHCIGALDGKHIVITAPQNSGSAYYNYKYSHSIILLAVCDANYCFTLVDIGAEGRQSDGGVFSKSVLGQLINQNNLNVPEPSVVSENRAHLSYVFVADEAFALTNAVMRPFPGKSGFNQEKRIFNYRLSRARRCIENTFGIYVARWQIFRKPILCSLITLDNIVKATVCLHNFIKRYEEHLDPSQRRYCPPNFVDEESGDDGLSTGEWHSFESGGLQNLHRSGANSYSRNAAETRNLFASYFSAEGAVEFQWDKL